MTFDSPLTWCERTGTFVLLDQTWEECREDARCTSCPYRACFTGHAFGAPAPPATPAEALPRVARDGTRRRGAQAPCQRAGRRATKAATPSWKSALP